MSIARKVAVTAATAALVSSLTTPAHAESFDTSHQQREAFRSELADFVASTSAPPVTAKPGTDEYAAQVSAQYRYWSSVPWDAYFGALGYSDIDVTTGITTSEDGIPTAWWSAVVPNEIAEVTSHPIAEVLDIAAEPNRIIISPMASDCVLSSYSYNAHTCIYNNQGDNASSAQWRNGSSTASTTKTFRGRVGQNQYSSGTCYNITNMATGPLATVGLGSTYVLSFTSWFTSRFGMAGYNSALSVRHFLDCINDFI
jgi:hypothetical protein